MTGIDVPETPNLIKIIMLIIAEYMYPSVN